MYIKRHLEKQFLSMSSFFKAVLVTGARQVGKTTMLKHLSQGRSYASLDDIDALTLARTDPKMFFMKFKPPVIIDEVQKAPELFPYIKIMCDNTAETGLFWLTGSEQYSMMQNITESLAGRVGILNLFPLSLSEIRNIEYEEPINFSLDALIKRDALKQSQSLDSIFNYIWKGGMPAVQSANEKERHIYFSSYVNSYILRDVAIEGGVSNTIGFNKFLKACANSVAQQLNLNNLAMISDISQPTAKVWLNLLVRLNIVFLLQPYSNNRLKRLAKAPKLYFCDSGLCGYLANWTSIDNILNSHFSGHFFENFVVLELIKSLENNLQNYSLTYYRDSNNKEVDLFLEQNGKVHPLEIKLSASPDRREIKKFDFLDKYEIPRGEGGIICMCDSVLPIDKNNSYIPASII